MSPKTRSITKPRTRRTTPAPTVTSAEADVSRPRRERKAAASSAGLARDGITPLITAAGKMLALLAPEMAEARTTLTAATPRLYGPLVAAVARVFREVTDMPADARKVAYRDLTARIRDAAGFTVEDTTAPGGMNAAAWSAGKSILSRARTVLEYLHDSDHRRAATVSAYWAQQDYDRYTLDAEYAARRQAIGTAVATLERRALRALRALVAAGGEPGAVILRLQATEAAGASPGASVVNP